MTERRPDHERQTRRATILMLCTIFGVYLCSSSWRFPLGNDGRATLATSLSLLTERSMAVDADFASDGGFAPSGKVGVDGRTYVKYGLGLPIIELPLVALALLISSFASVTEMQALSAAMSLLNPLLTTGTALTVYSLCRSVSPAATARFVTIGYAFSTLAWPYAGVDGGEPLQALCLAAAMCSLLKYRLSQSATFLTGSGFLLGYAIFTKPANAVLVPAYVLYVMAVCRARSLSAPEHVRALMRFAPPIAMCVVALAWLNWVRFGSVFETGYEPHAFTNRWLTGVYGLTVTLNKGLLFYAPLVVLAPVGIWLMRKESRAEAMLILSASLVYISLFAKFYDWGAGWSWGPRYLVPVLPLLMVPVARAVAAARIWRYVAAVLFAVGFAVNGVGVLVDGDAYHSSIMNIDLTTRTGFVQIGSVREPGEMLAMPVPPDYVIPEFSEILGKLWLARVALDGCWCNDKAQCGCPTGTFETNRQFSSPPWIRQYPLARPEPPYGSRLMNPWIAHAIHRWFVR